MAYNTLKASIGAAIYDNDNKEITGMIMQNALIDVINTLGTGYQYMGMCTPATNPTSIIGDKQLFYLTTTPGTYTYMGNFTHDGGIAVLSYNGTTWSYNRLTPGEEVGIFDISAYNGDDEYAYLAAALGTNGANVPTSERRGGLTVQFINSSTGQYEIWQLMSNTWSISPSNWQLVGDSQLNVKLRGITAQETKIKLVQNSNWYDGLYVTADGAISQGTTPAGGVPNGVLIIPVVGGMRIRFLGIKTVNPNNAGYGFSVGPINPNISTPQLEDVYQFESGASSNTAYEYLVEVPTGMHYFACTIRKYGTSQTAVITLDDFYCYKQSGVPAASTFKSGEFLGDVTINKSATIGSSSLPTGESVAILDALMPRIKGKEDAIIQLQHASQSIEPDTNGSKYSWIFNVVPGTTLIAQGTYGRGLFAAVYEDVESALMADATKRLETLFSYTLDNQEVVINTRGVLRVACSDVGNDPINVEQVISQTSITVVYLGTALDRVIEGKSGVPTLLSYPIVFTYGVFNANNTKQRFEIPQFRIWIGANSYLVDAQIVEYPFETDQRKWFFLVLADNFVDVEVKAHTQITKENQSRIVAIFYRDSSTSRYVTYFRGSGSPIKWNINGVYDEEINSINYTLGVSKDRGLLNADYIIRFTTSTSLGYSLVDNPEGLRLRIIYKVNVGDKVDIRTRNNQAVFVGVWRNTDQALHSLSAEALQVVTETYSTQSSLSFTVQNGGYLCISSKKEDGTAISDTDLEEILSNIKIYIAQGALRKVEHSYDVANHLQNYPLSEVACGTVWSGTSNTDHWARINRDSTTARVASVDCLALPYNGVTLRFKLPDEYLLSIRIFDGYSNKQYPSTGGKWFIDGDTYTVGTRFSHFMFSMARRADYDPTNEDTQNGRTPDESFVFDEDAVEEVNRLIRRGEIAIMYEDSDVVSRYEHFSGNIKSTLLHYTSDKTQNFPQTLPTLIHCSDIHGDITRWSNILKIGSRIKPNAVVFTGDCVAYHVNNGASYLYNCAKSVIGEYQVLVALGNHDANGETEYKAHLNLNMYNLILAPFVESFGYSVPSSTQYDEAPTYYYKDLSEASLRVVTLNLYDTGLLNWANNSFSQKQINWLISVLNSTPRNYGVLIDYHRSLGPVVKDPLYDKFWQESSTTGYPPSTWELTGVTGTPIQDIVDAFINRTTLQESFTVTTLTGTTTINIDADFTSVATGVEFIAHMFGHHHRDTIGYYQGTQNKQLTLCICQTTAAYATEYTSWANPSDLPRFGGGKEQDAFNIYSIDRVSKTVRVSKFGSNMSSETLKIRDCMVIPYV